MAGSGQPTWVTTAGPYAGAFVLPVLATAVTAALPSVFWSVPAVSYLAAVALEAYLAGMVPAIVSAVLSMLLLDYFFIPPLHGLTFDMQHVLHGVAFVGSAVVISGLNEKVKRERARAEERAEEARRAEAERDRLYREAERASRAKDEFLAIASHELRTPLNAILGWIDLLRATRLEPEAAERAMQTIQRNAEIQARLISDILDISRIVSGRLTLDLTEVDAAAVLLAAAEMVRPEAGTKRIALEADLAATPSARVRADAGRLQQIFGNLLTNAVKFTPEGGRVQARLEQADGAVRVTVRDNGIGIAPDFLPHVFERFRQADSSSTRAFHGLGLGLAIAHELVLLHGGQIAVASDGPGRGTVFTVTLPAREHAPDRAGPEGGQPGRVSLDGLRLLVVDDDPDTLELLAVALGREGAEVAPAGSVAAALAVLDRGFSPDVLLSDLGMPEQDGWTLISQVRSRPAGSGGRVPSIAVTAYASADDKTKALARGFDAYVAKPVRMEELCRIIAAIGHRPTAGTA